MMPGKTYLQEANGNLSTPFACCWPFRLPA